MLTSVHHADEIVLTMTCKMYGILCVVDKSSDVAFTTGPGTQLKPEEFQLVRIWFHFIMRN